MTKGYARKLKKEEAATVSKTTWFLPHHPVSNPNKPGKVRVVFDAAARFSGTSLNEKLMQGPSLTNDLSGVLIVSVRKKLPSQQISRACFTRPE